jgi:ABC-type glutathione transport system ATPase component
MSIAVQELTQTPAASRPIVQSVPAGPAALLVDHATKRFKVDQRKPPVVAVDDVSIRIERGEIYGLLGANGSGKSTFIRLVSGLLTLDAGRVEVFGHDLVREEMAVKRLVNRVSVDAAPHVPPQRLNAAEIRRRISAEVPAWAYRCRRWRPDAVYPEQSGRSQGRLRPACVTRSRSCPAGCS